MLPGNDQRLLHSSFWASFQIFNLNLISRLPSRLLWAFAIWSAHVGFRWGTTEGIDSKHESRWAFWTLLNYGHPAGILEVDRCPAYDPIPLKCSKWIKHARLPWNCFWWTYRHILISRTITYRAARVIVNQSGRVMWPVVKLTAADHWHLYMPATSPGMCRCPAGKLHQKQAAAR